MELKINKLKIKNTIFLSIVRNILYTLFLIGTFLIFNLPVHASVSSFDLLTNPNQYNGKEIVYEGEVIGDIMGHWINVNDGNTAIGIFAEDQRLLDEISYLGKYKAIGDTVRITGVFYKTDPNHGGDLDIRANKLEVIKLGQKIDHPLKIDKVYSLLILFGVTILVYIIKTILFRRKS